MAPATQSGTEDFGAIAKVWQAIQGHWLSACLGVLVDLRIPDVLAQESGPIGLEELAPKAGVSKKGQDHLYKVLRVLAQWDLLDELPGRKFVANRATKQLVRGDEPSLGHMVAHQINKPKWEAWKLLPEAVQSGETAFCLAHGGENMYQWGERKENADFSAEFMKSMTYFTNLSLKGGEVTLEAAYDWPACTSIMDVGGGRGELLSRCMSYGRDCKGILFDRSYVIDGVDVGKTFQAKGVNKELLSMIVGDVMEPFPEAVKAAQLDTIIMKHFLSAFSDADAQTIIKHCSQVLPDSAKILLLQTLVPEPGDKDHNVCADGVAPGLFAIEILAQCPGGAWRTLSEWETIFASQKFKLDAAKAVGGNMHMMIWSRQ
ncbi:hypothetical protein WJX72_009378 [[Myrmecia] bisecta]|uniref:Uncharacterized protein n=1 Tax=[Myrmecia] bisecta TaxID=41462 RepID=A0AAW1QGH6_9CHLO